VAGGNESKREDRMMSGGELLAPVFSENDKTGSQKKIIHNKHQAIKKKENTTTKKATS